MQINNNLKTNKKNRKSNMIIYPKLAFQFPSCQRPMKSLSSSHLIKKNPYFVRTRVHTVQRSFNCNIKCQYFICLSVVIKSHLRIFCSCGDVTIAVKDRVCFWAGRGLYCATYVMTLDLVFLGVIRKSCWSWPYTQLIFLTYLQKWFEYTSVRL